MGHRKTKTKNNRTEVETDTHPSAVRVAGELIGQFLNPWTPAPTNGNNELNEPSFYFFTHARPHGLSLSSPSFFSFGFHFVCFAFPGSTVFPMRYTSADCCVSSGLPCFTLSQSSLKMASLSGNALPGTLLHRLAKKNPKKLIHLFKNHRSRSIESETCHLEDAQKNESMIFFTPLLGIGINLT